MTKGRTLVAAALFGALAVLAYLFMRPPGPGTEGPAGSARETSPGAEFAVAPTPRPPAGLPLRLGASPSAPDDRPASFEGRVVSAETLAGVAGAELTFSRGGAAASVRAGPDGSFSFAPPAAGRWHLAAVTARGFFPFAPEWGHSPVRLDARPGLHLRGLEIHLAPAVELEGRVVDGEGAPVEGADVRLRGTAGEASLVTVPDRFRSGPDGRFAVAAPEGSALEASKDGYLPGLAEVGVPELVNRRVTVALGPRHAPLGAAGPIEGVVVAAGGGPLEGALVTAAREGFPGGPGVVAAQAASGAGGRFALGDLAPGTYRLTARAEGRAPASLRRVEPGSRDLVLELAPGGRLRGCVRDAAGGGPVSPFTVMVFERRSALRLVLQRSVSVLDPGGCWELDDLVPGPAAVVVSAPGHAPSEESRVEIPAPGEVATLDVALAAGGRLHGRVVDAATRAPVAGARLSVEGSLSGAASTFPVLGEATSGPGGAFELSGLPRRFSVFVAAAGHHARILGGLEAGPGERRGPVEVALHAVEAGEEPRTELSGIGIQLAPHGDALTVTGVLAGGGAAAAGVRRGDDVVEVDGRPVDELGLGGAIERIRGPEGTTVTLTLRRGDEVLRLAVPRGQVRG